MSVPCGALHGAGSAPPRLEMPGQSGGGGGLVGAAGASWGTSTPSLFPSSKMALLPEGHGSQFPYISIVMLGSMVRLNSHSPSSL